MEPEPPTMDAIIPEPIEPCQAIMGHEQGIGSHNPYLVEFMGFAVMCRTADAALELARLIAASE